MFPDRTSFLGQAYCMHSGDVPMIPTRSSARSAAASLAFCLESKPSKPRNDMLIIDHPCRLQRMER